MQVSQCHDLLAEILQLSSSLPAALQSPGGRFGPILFDFRFFRDPDAHERKVEASQELADLDEDFREVGKHMQHLRMTVTIPRATCALEGAGHHLHVSRMRRLG